MPPSIRFLRRSFYSFAQDFCRILVKYLTTMHKSKKKIDKSAKIPKPIKIKKEKTEEDRTPQPMSHYIDDRLELVKQIFGTLKPKTITNLAPEFLKKKDLDEIQELCLNELLGISTKRLLSIINATKCPTDTESSSDSDVHNVEEHVSLEEISSDSEIEGSSSRHRKKKSNGGAKGPSKKKDGEKNENDGQISVLELLELQARARAIRSQLALEPVTKIEVNSGDESEEVSSVRSKESEITSKRDRKRNSNELAIAEGSRNSKESRKPTKQTTSNGNVENISSNDNVGFRQKIKLKRNFRSNKECANSNKDNAEEATTSSTKEIKEEKLSRSASPDVIPIVAEPITLMIGDTSDEDVGIKDKELDKAAETALSQDSTSVNRTDDMQILAISFNCEETEPGRCNGEPEDGEILDENESKSAKKGENNPTNTETNNANTDGSKEEVNASLTEDIESLAPENLDKCEAFKPVDPVTADSAPATNTQMQATNTHDNTNLEGREITKGQKDVPSKALDHSTVDDEYYDDQNDDVISIEGGDLENEMTEHLEDNSSQAIQCEEETKRNKESANCSREVEDDIISLDSSEDELTKDSTESWNSRWLKSSKVSKVLAASRLGKRVRDNIKKTKRPNSDFSNDEDKTTTKGSSSQYTSKHEDGSMEQYKELLEIRQQRKN